MYSRTSDNSGRTGTEHEQETASQNRSWWRELTKFEPIPYP